MREQLLAAVHARMARFATDQDLDAVLSDDALVEIAALFATAPDPTTDLEILKAAGWLHWCRYLALGPDGELQDLADALRILAPLYRQQPDEVPDPIRQFFDDDPSATESPDAVTVNGHQALANRAIQRLQSAAASDESDALTGTIDLLREAAAATPPDHANRATILSNLGEALRIQFRNTKKLADLDEAIEVSEEAVAAAPTDYPNRAAILSNLGLALGTRFQCTGVLADLTRSIGRLREAVAAAPPDHPNRAELLSNLGIGLEVRYALIDTADLDQAIAVGEQTVADIPAEHPDRAKFLSALGAALQNRYVRDRALIDLDRAIDRLREAVASTPPDQPDRAGRLTSLGAALQTRYARTGVPTDLDQAIDWLQEAMSATPPDHVTHVAMLTSLGAARATLYERTAKLTDLDQAIEWLQEAMTIVTPDDPNRAAILSNLGGALWARSKITGELTDFNHAISRLRAGLAVVQPDNPNHVTIVTNLHHVLKARFERTGALTDLDQAIDVVEHALADTPTDHRNRATFLNLLGSNWATRYDRTGVMADLDRAVELGEQAVAAVSTDHPDRPGYLANLGAFLHDRYRRTVELTELDQAINFGEQAVAATSPDEPNLARFLTNLGTALRSRADQTGDAADAERAVVVSEQAVAATPTNHPHRAARLSNLSAALITRYERNRAIADLNQAIVVGKQAVAAIPSDHIDRATALYNLGGALATEFQRTGTRYALDDAVEVYQEVVASETAPAPFRAEAARRWGQLAAAGQDWAAAVKAFGTAVELLARVVPRSLGRSDQEYWLTELAGLGAQAAACCVQAEQPERAVELWEQGRGVLLGQALDTRTDLTQLAKHPRLLAKFVQLRDELDTVSETASTGSPILSASAGLQSDIDPTATRRKIDRRRELADQFGQLLDEIRAKPGLDRFLLPPPIGDLLAASHEGPVVLINVSDIRSDALLLISTGVEVVPLPQLTPQTIQDQVVAFLSALDDARDPTTGPADWYQAEQRLSEILGWLWDTLAEPVLHQLGITEPFNSNANNDGGVGKYWPRLWWCPSGLLAFLPLHAAGRHDTRFDATPHTVLDRVVSSYTPTVRALIHARRPIFTGMAQTAVDSAAGSTEAVRLLVIAMPHTPAARDLPGAVTEAALLRRLFPGQTILLHGDLEPDEAARLGNPIASPGSGRAEYERVRAALPRCRWAHFACHAESDLTDPSASHLLLIDHQHRPMTVLGLTQLRLDNAELAFLSACATARTGLRLADEAVQLAAAFQLAGYRHVIATLWPIDDRAAVRVATNFYTILGSSGTTDAAPHALHHGTRRQRNLAADRPSIWAAYLHGGA